MPAEEEDESFTSVDRGDNGGRSCAPVGKAEKGGERKEEDGGENRTFRGSFLSFPNQIYYFNK